MFSECCTPLVSKLSPHWRKLDIRAMIMQSAAYTLVRDMHKYPAGGYCRALAVLFLLVLHKVTDNGLAAFCGLV